MSKLKLLEEVNNLVDVETVNSDNINIVLANIIENVDLSDNEYEAVLNYLRGEEDVSEEFGC